MQSVRRLLALFMLFAGLLLAVSSATSALTEQASMLFENVPGVAAVGIIGLLSTLIVIACLFYIMAVIAVTASLLPGSWSRKLALTLPAFFLVVLLVGVLMEGLDIGEGAFATGWLALSGGLTLAATIVAVLRLDLGYGTLRRAMAGMAVATIPLALVCMAIFASLVIASTNQPEAPTVGGQGAASGSNAPTPPGEGVEAGRLAQQAAQGGQPSSQPGGGGR